MRRKLKEAEEQLEEVRIRLKYVPFWSDTGDLIQSIEKYKKLTAPLRAEEEILNHRIEGLKKEIAGAIMRTKRDKKEKSEHEKVKEDVEKLKKVKPNSTLNDLFFEVADSHGKTFEATKKAYYYKGKKVTKLS